MSQLTRLYERTLDGICDLEDCEKCECHQISSYADLEFIWELMKCKPTSYLDAVNIQLYHNDQLVPLSNVASKLQNEDCLPVNWIEQSFQNSVLLSVDNT